MKSLYIPDNNVKHDVSILYYNARSLIPKLDELKMECVNRRPDIILCIVETWLDDTVSRYHYLTII